MNHEKLLGFQNDKLVKKTVWSRLKWLEKLSLQIIIWLSIILLKESGINNDLVTIRISLKYLQLLGPRSSKSPACSGSIWSVCGLRNSFLRKSKEIWRIDDDRLCRRFRSLAITKHNFEVGSLKMVNHVYFNHNLMSCSGTRLIWSVTIRLMWSNWTRLTMIPITL